MVRLELLVRLEAKPGQKAEVECFLCGGPSVVQEQPAMTALVAIRLGPSTFGNFDAFPIKEGLRAKASDLFALAPTIEKVDVVPAMLPG